MPKVTRIKLQWPAPHLSHMDNQSSFVSPSSAVDGVSGVQWDPHGDGHLLVSMRSGRIFIWDIPFTSSSLASSSTSSKRNGDGGESTPRVIAAYPPAGGAGGGVAAVSWVRHIPGGFCTADGRSGIIRLWSVSSQRYPSYAYIF